MDFDTMPTVNSYTALTIVSAMMFGEDSKDQDRARWYGPGQVGCVCDGVTSSANSGEAAELSASFAPVLFEGSIKDKLSTLCGLLMARRQELQQSSVVVPDGTPLGMQDLLRKVIREKRSISFQTTMVAVKLVCEEKAVRAYILKCGDSAFLAYSGEGELLSSSITYPYSPGNHEETANRRTNFSSSREMSFGPGDQILVRVEGLLSEYKGLAERAGIKNEHIDNWLVCTPMDVCYSHDIVNENTLQRRPLSLKVADQVIVPRYLYGTQLASKGQRYRFLDYSSTIRLVSVTGPNALADQIGQHGSTTMVLPDHFYCGYIESYQDRFPVGTQFVLCSDGLYSSFLDARRLWTWLHDNARALSHKDERTPVLKQLHSRLHAKGGDDDISFVWIHPRRSDVIGTQDSKAIDKQE